MCYMVYLRYLLHATRKTDVRGLAFVCTSTNRTSSGVQSLYGALWRASKRGSSLPSFSSASLCSLSIVVCCSAAAYAIGSRDCDGTATMCQRRHVITRGGGCIALKIRVKPPPSTLRSKAKEKPRRPVQGGKGVIIYICLSAGVNDLKKQNI